VNKTLPLFLVCASILLTGCERLKGHLTVYSNFQLNNHHIIRRTAAFSPGTYSTRMTLHPVQNVVDIKAEGHSLIKIPIPHHFMKNDGTFTIRGSDLGESWNAFGTFYTTVQSSPQRHAEISCELYTVYSRRSGNYTVYGTRDVIEHTQTTTRQLNLKFASLDNQNVLANLTGDDTQTKTIIDEYLNSCH